MTLEPLKFISEKKLIELHRDVSNNLERYRNGDFLDLMHDNGWSIETNSVKVDIELLSKLDGSKGTAAADIENSLLVYKALPGMTPALARDERIWVRLTHIECLSYSRARWLKESDKERLEKKILLHMFGPSLTAIRDDNALSRLWWNAHIATIADPDDPDGALRLISKTADIRSNFIERTSTVSRRPLTRAILKEMRREPLITSKEINFRIFMKTLNRNGGGVLFEALNDDDSEVFVRNCTTIVKKLI